jgi:hypothetical protein
VLHLGTDRTFAYDDVPQSIQETETIAYQLRFDQISQNKRHHPAYHHGEFSFHAQACAYWFKERPKRSRHRRSQARKVHLKSSQHRTEGLVYDPFAARLVLLSVSTSYCSDKNRLFLPDKSKSGSNTATRLVSPFAACITAQPSY